MPTESQRQTRALNEIAAEIQNDWGDRLNVRATPYVEAMSGLRSVHDQYGLETGADVVRRFLLNAGAWRGHVAQRIKKRIEQYSKGP
jgi:hypothetical protein